MVAGREIALFEISLLATGAHDQITLECKSIYHYFVASIRSIIS